MGKEMLGTQGSAGVVVEGVAVDVDVTDRVLGEKPGSRIRGK